MGRNGRPVLRCCMGACRSVRRGFARWRGMSDFVAARGSGTRGSLAPGAVGAADTGWFGHVEMAPRFQPVRDQVVPAAELLHGDVETIGYGHQRVAVFDPVKR